MFMNQVPLTLLRARGAPLRCGAPTWTTWGSTKESLGFETGTATLDDLLLFFLFYIFF